MNFEPLSLLIILVSLCITLGWGWYFCFVRKTFSWLDFYWSLSFLLVLALQKIIVFFQTGNFSLRPIDLLYGFWSIRLSSHLFMRIRKSGEDSRYQELKKEWKVWYGLKFFILFQSEALLTFILSIPLFLTYPTVSSLWVYTSIGLFLIAIGGEIIADNQLKAFKKENRDPSKVCNIGLWRYSRHPNYFFEWLIWISFAIYGLSSEEKWPGFIPAVIMFVLLTKVTGIPYAEASSIKSKKERYLQYQKETNAFFPWFPKTKIMIVTLLLAISTNSSLAIGNNMQQEKIKHVFNTLRADNLKVLDDFYDPNTEFIDPIGTHRGIKAVKDYYENLYKNVKDIRFEYKDLVSSGNTHVLIWTMILTAEGLNGGKPVILSGSSHIKFNESNLVIYHRDYFDMGEFIYEHVPLLGWTIKHIKTRLRGEK